MMSARDDKRRKLQTHTCDPPEKIHICLTCTVRPEKCFGTCDLTRKAKMLNGEGKDGDKRR